MPESGAVPVPRDVPFEALATLGCAVLTGVGAVTNAAKAAPGSRVAVIGAGGVGLNVIQGAAIAGCETIVAIDRRPALIARCTALADVRAALQLARDSRLPFRVRGGGHGVDRLAVDDDVLVIDLSPMRGVRVEGRRAFVQGGATWRELVQRIDAASARLVDRRDRFRHLDPEDREGVAGVAGDVARLHLLLDRLHAAEIEARYRTVLKDNRARDAAAGRTLDGPHLTDLSVVFAAKGVPAADASTGEQKALLIGLVLAHAGLIAEMIGFAPVLLLDEVVAHLDPGRRSALYAELETIGAQVFMTGADPAAFAEIGTRADIFDVSPGLVVRRRA